MEKNMLASAIYADWTCFRTGESESVVIKKSQKSWGKQ